jgi:hypothetical protein
VRRRWIATALVGSAWLAGSAASAVCPCAPVTVEQAYQSARLVFTGEVSGFTPVDAACETVGAEDAVGAIYTVRVLEGLKGPRATEHRIYAADPASGSRAARADVSARLARWSRDVGKSFLWFASGERNLVNSCASSEMYHDIEVKLSELRRLRAGERRGTGALAPAPSDEASAEPCRPPPCG